MNLTEVTWYCVGLIIKACEYPLLKFLIGIGLGILMFFFDALQKDALMALFFLIIMDCMTAIHAAARHDELIQSRKLFRSAVKMAMYFTLISAGFMTEKATPIPFIDDTILGFLAVTELISILENTSKAGYAIPAALLQKMKDFAKLK